MGRYPLEMGNWWAASGVEACGFEWLGARRAEAKAAGPYSRRGTSRGRQRGGGAPRRQTGQALVQEDVSGRIEERCRRVGYLDRDAHVGGFIGL